MNEDKLINERIAILSNVENPEIEKYLIEKYKIKLNRAKGKNFFSYYEKNHFVIADIKNINDNPVLHFSYFYLPANLINHAYINTFIDEIKSNCGLNNCEIAIDLDNKQQMEIDILSKLGYLPYAILAIGSTEQLRLFSMDCGKICHQFKVRNAEISDLEFIFNVERNALSVSPYNRVNFGDLMVKNNIINTYDELIRKKCAIVLVNQNNTIIGTACFIPNNDYLVGFLKSIAILPEYQGNGLSKMLYSQIANRLLSFENFYYSSITTSSLVLKIAKKTKRTVLNWTMVKKVNLEL